MSIGEFAFHNNTSDRNTTVTPIFLMDSLAVSFTPNGRTSWADEASTQVIVDGSGITNLRYLWTTSIDEPDVSDVVNSFSNGQTITAPEGSF